jgi:ABC-type Fe3+/spermidine/putrescine transport system ATPase subunit
MIELQNITKKYDQTTAVKTVSLKIAKGETIIAVGPSGSGKTTLLRIIAGLEAPDRGKLFINGQLASQPGKIIIPPHRRQLGMIFQDLALWPHLSVQQNLEFGLKALKVKKAARQDKIAAILNLMALDGYQTRYPHSLSEGEKQRVAIARTIITEPQIMLMDEPLSSLDTVLKNELLEMIIELVRKLKILLIYVTHDRGETLAFNARIVVMFQGSMIQDGDWKALNANPANTFVKKFVISWVSKTELENRDRDHHP